MCRLDLWDKIMGLLFSGAWGWRGEEAGAQRLRAAAPALL